MKRLLLPITTLCVVICVLALAGALVVGAAAQSDQIAFDSARSGNTDIFLLDTQRGILARLTRENTLDFSPAWSPDGQQIAYISQSPQRLESSLIVMNWNGTQRRSLASVQLNGIVNSALAWSPDGSQIAYTTSDDSGSQGVYMIDVEGSTPLRVTESRGNVFSPTWSPDGQLAFAWSPVANTEIYVFSPQLVETMDSHTPVPSPQRITNSYYTDTAPAWSPDGEWIAFVSDRAGTSDVYLMRPDGNDLHALTATNDRDANPTWSPDGRRLAFVSNRDGARTIYMMWSDGSDVRRLLDAVSEDNRPAWRPGSPLS
ncbi:MAG: WD40 domain-containing protein [Chloroflexi bacterium OLB15]|nr:MAG: WD40 domain-containing protein [Chloroflexi bacterium OLB15]